jgi:hypothetical protein
LKKGSLLLVSTGSTFPEIEFIALVSFIEVGFYEEIKLPVLKAGAITVPALFFKRIARG